MNSQGSQSLWLMRFGAVVFAASLPLTSTNCAYANNDRAAALLNNATARENWRAARHEARDMRREARIENQAATAAQTHRAANVVNVDPINAHIHRGTTAILFPGQVSTFRTSRPHQISTYTNDAGKTRALTHDVSLDLSSTEANITVGDKLLNGSTTIDVAGETKTISAGSKLTAAEYAALNQKLATGTQSLHLSAAGSADSGNLDLNIVSEDGRSIKASELVIPQNVTVTGDFARTTDGVTVTNDIVNYGSIVADSNRKNTAIFAARDIDNHTGASISTTTASEVNLTLRADRDINNDGSITASGNLELSAGNAINLSSNSVSQASGSVSLNSSSINNHGLISSVNQDVTLSSPSGTNMLVDNSGGTISAQLGAINVRSADYQDIGNSTITGGNLLSQNLNLNSGAGTTDVFVNELTGTIKSTGTAVHVSAQTDALTIGSQCLIGDPTYFNTGDIILDGDIDVGENLAIIAGGNITTGSASLSIVAREPFTGQGFNITMIAGANITTPGSGQISPAGGPADLPPQSQPTYSQNATANVTINGASASGGNIDLTSAFFGVTIDSSSTGGNLNGANVTLAAFADPSGNAGLVMIQSGQIMTQGNTFGSNGNVTVIAGGNGVNFLPAINTSGGFGGGGNIIVSSTQPTSSNGLPITFDTTGSITSGNSLVTGTFTATSSNFQMLAGLNAAGNITVRTGGYAQFGDNTNASSQDVIAYTQNLDLNGAVTVINTASFAAPSNLGTLNVANSILAQNVSLQIGPQGAMNIGFIQATNSASIVLGDNAIAGQSNTIFTPTLNVTMGANSQLSLDGALNYITSLAINNTAGSGFARVANLQTPTTVTSITGTNLFLDLTSGDSIFFTSPSIQLDTLSVNAKSIFVDGNITCGLANLIAFDGDITINPGRTLHATDVSIQASGAGDINSSGNLIGDNTLTVNVAGSGSMALDGQVTGARVELDASQGDITQSSTGIVATDLIINLFGNNMANLATATNNVQFLTTNTSGVSTIAVKAGNIQLKQQSGIGTSLVVQANQITTTDFIDVTVVSFESSSSVTIDSNINLGAFGSITATGNVNITGSGGIFSGGDIDILSSSGNVVIDGNLTATTFLSAEATTGSIHINNNISGQFMQLKAGGSTSVIDETGPGTISTLDLSLVLSSAAGTPTANLLSSNNIGTIGTTAGGAASFNVHNGSSMDIGLIQGSPLQNLDFSTSSGNLNFASLPFTVNQLSLQSPLTINLFNTIQANGATTLSAPIINVSGDLTGAGAKDFTADTSMNINALISGPSITLNTTNGNISQTSGGTITTNSLLLNAADGFFGLDQAANHIDVLNTNITGAGQVFLNNGTNTITLDNLVGGNQTLVATTTGDIHLTGPAKSIGYLDLHGNNIDFSTATSTVSFFSATASTSILVAQPISTTAGSLNLNVTGAGNIGLSDTVQGNVVNLTTNGGAISHTASGLITGNTLTINMDGGSTDVITNIQILNTQVINGGTIAVDNGVLTLFATSATGDGTQDLTLISAGNVTASGTTFNVHNLTITSGAIASVSGVTATGTTNIQGLTFAIGDLGGAGDKTITATGALAAPALSGNISGNTVTFNLAGGNLFQLSGGITTSSLTINESTATSVFLNGLDPNNVGSLTTNVTGAANLDLRNGGNPITITALNGTSQIAQIFGGAISIPNPIDVERLTLRGTGADMTVGVNIHTVSGLTLEVSNGNLEIAASSTLTNDFAQMTLLVSSGSGDVTINGTVSSNPILVSNQGTGDIHLNSAIVTPDLRLVGTSGDIVQSAPIDAVQLIVNLTTGTATLTQVGNNFTNLKDTVTGSGTITIDNGSNPISLNGINGGALDITTTGTFGISVQ